MATNDRTIRSTDPDNTATPVTAPSTTEQLLAQTLQALAQSNAKMTELMEQQAAYNKAALKIAPRRKKSMREFRKEHPEKRLLHEVYQNGRLVNPAGLSVETIERLDTLATGVYADGLLEVRRVREGKDGQNSRIHLMYNNKTQDQRTEFYMRFPTFKSIVDTVVAEMAARVVEATEGEFKDPATAARYRPVHEASAVGSVISDDDTPEDIIE